MTFTKEGISSSEIRSLCKKMQLQGGLDGLIIDHINILDKKDLGANIREQTTNICMEFKNMAKEFNIPVIILSHLNRACDARPDKRPMLSNVKESSGIEENADVVMMLYRDDYYYKDSEEKMY
jgi:replicative DNA helicase